METGKICANIYTYYGSMKYEQYVQICTYNKCRYSEETRVLDMVLYNLAALICDKNCTNMCKYVQV